MPVIRRLICAGRHCLKDERVNNVCGIRCWKSVCAQLRNAPAFKRCNESANNAEYMIDTCGSGFSLKTAAVIAVLFGSIHLSLMSSSNEQKPDTKYSTGNDVSRVHRTSKVVQSEGILRKQEDKENYVARLQKQALEQSLLSLISNATMKVKRALAGYNSGCNFSQTNYSSASNELEVDNEQDSVFGVDGLDGLVKKADARREINKILNVVSIGRQEAGTRDHPLLVLAEATAHYLKKQMDYVEAQMRLQ